MAENEVKIGHLYYPNPLRSDSNARAAQRIGPTRFSRNEGPCGPCYFRDHAKIGFWSPGKIAQSFQPAPDLGARFAPKGTAPGAGPVSVVVQATEGVIVCESDGRTQTYFPADFFAAFEPYRPAVFVTGDRVRFRSRLDLIEALGRRPETLIAPLHGWTVVGIKFHEDARRLYAIERPGFPDSCAFENRIEADRIEADPVRIYEVRDLRVQIGGVDVSDYLRPPSFQWTIPIRLEDPDALRPLWSHYGSIGRSPAPIPAEPTPRARLLASIDAFRDRDAGSEFTAAMDVGRALSDLIYAERGRGLTKADRSLRAPLERAIDLYDNAPDGGLVDASPVVLAVDALIAACRAAR